MLSVEPEAAVLPVGSDGVNSPSHGVLHFWGIIVSSPSYSILYAQNFVSGSAYLCHGAVLP